MRIKRISIRCVDMAPYIIPTGMNWCLTVEVVSANGDNTKWSYEYRQYSGSFKAALASMRPDSSFCRYLRVQGVKVY